MPNAAYIGSPARLFPVEWVTALRADTESRYTVMEASSRRWAFVQTASGAPAPRSWDVLSTSDNESSAVLRGLAHGAYGAGPFVWMPESAYITNALTPRQSLLSGAAGGGVEAVDGWSPTSILGPASTTLVTGVPIVPGEPVTASVDVSGAATLQVVFRNATGGVVTVQSVASTGTLMQRLHRTTPAAPANARTVDLVVSGHIRVTRPQVTWTHHLMPWSFGEGARSVIIEKLTTTPFLLDGGSRDTWTTVTAILTEVS